MASTADFKNGLCFRYNTDLVTIMEFLHVKPGKGPAFVRTKLRSLNTGKIYDVTFNSGVKIDTVRVERRNVQFLYKDESGYHFMNTDDFEQIAVEEFQINSPQFLKESNEAEMMYDTDEDRVLSVELKPFVELEITYTEPGIKGDTATNTLKPAKVETGAEVRVPLFINIGDKVRIDTRTGDYMERVK
ncbi:MAG: elongation factor P [Flavobacteriales bacterium]|nr:elongation factor P [Flavobacteriales bacterium]HRE74092.1 elongation factor P [Flavobacteriales bacterium]HRE95123.1 elongation factor P [Flavobacteriales bacterium]HRJ39784.1 elongation factor P [Flavobacteriales bacterium]